VQPRRGGEERSSARNKEACDRVPKFSGDRPRSGLRGGRRLLRGSAATEMRRLHGKETALQGSRGAGVAGSVSGRGAPRWILGDVLTGREPAAERGNWAVRIGGERAVSLRQRRWEGAYSRLRASALARELSGNADGSEQPRHDHLGRGGLLDGGVRVPGGPGCVVRLGPQAVPPRSSSTTRRTAAQSSRPATPARSAAASRVCGASTRCQLGPICTRRPAHARRARRQRVRVRSRPVAAARSSVAR